MPCIIVVSFGIGVRHHGRATGQGLAPTPPVAWPPPPHPPPASPIGASSGHVIGFSAKLTPLGFASFHGRRGVGEKRVPQSFCRAI